VIRLKGVTCYAIALSMSRILEAILGNERSVFTVSTPLQGFMGLQDVCLSVPAVLHREGVRELLPLQLDPGELEAFRRSAGILQETLRSVGYA
jgi:L-lactate dehydrogenase